MTDLALGRLVPKDELRRCFEAMLPGAHVVAQDEGEDMSCDFDVHVSIAPNPSEFPLGLSLLAAMRSGRDFELWLVGVARALSESFHTRSICDGTRFADSPAPYWSLIWDQGVAYLADDSGTRFADGEGGPVQVIRALSVDRSAVPAANELVDWVRRT